MMKYGGLVLLLTVVLIGGCSNTQEIVEKTSENEVKVSENNSQESSLVGGDTDEYGCLGPAGYSYNKEVSACIRAWELDEKQKTVAGIAMNKLKFKPGMTVVGTKGGRNKSGWVVEVELGPLKWEVKVKSGEVVEVNEVVKE